MYKMASRNCPIESFAKPSELMMLERPSYGTRGGELEFGPNPPPFGGSRISIDIASKLWFELQSCLKASGF
jgi:hypothetical protein